RRDQRERAGSPVRGHRAGAGHPRARRAPHDPRRDACAVDQRRREGKRACGAVRWGGSARRRRALARPLARPSDGAIAMDYGLYLSAAGVLTNMHRTDVHANNLANVATTGFKPDFAVIRQRLPERLEDNIADVPAHELLERLGGGVLVDPTRS